MTWDLPPELLGQPPAPVREPTPYDVLGSRWELYVPVPGSARSYVEGKGDDDADELVIRTADGRIVRRFTAADHPLPALELVQMELIDRDRWYALLQRQAVDLADEARSMTPTPVRRPGDRVAPEGTRTPPVWHDDGSVTLWHPESPGVRVRLYQPRLWRRTLRRRHPFATTAELVRHRRTIKSTHAALAYVVECKVCGDSTRWRALYLTKRWRVLHTHLTGHASYAVDGPDVIQVPPTPPRGPGGGSPRIPTTRGFRV